MGSWDKIPKLLKFQLTPDKKIFVHVMLKNVLDRTIIIKDKPTKST